MAAGLHHQGLGWRSVPWRWGKFGGFHSHGARGTPLDGLFHSIYSISTFFWNGVAGLGDFVGKESVVKKRSVWRFCGRSGWWINEEHEDVMTRFSLSSGKLTKLWTITIFHGKIHYKLWFSIVMLNYQRVSSLSPVLTWICAWYGHDVKRSFFIIENAPILPLPNIKDHENPYLAIPSYSQWLGSLFLE